MVIIAAALVPVVILTLLRVNSVLVLLSLCLGSVLVQFIAQDPSAVLSSLRVVPEQAPVDVSSPNIKLFFLLMPAVLTTIFMIHSVRGWLASIINLIPSLGVGLLIVLLGIPLLPTETARNLMASPIWQQGQQAQYIIVGLSAIAALFVLWLQRPPKHKDKHSKH